MIDLHCHILPGLDDGAPDAATSLAMAERAVADGIRTIAATPHVNFEYEYPLEAIGRGVRQLNELLSDAAVPISVVPGAELDASRAMELLPEQLRDLTLGDGPYLLVESPYQPIGEVLDEVLYQLQLQGLAPVLAHPERCPIFHANIDHLRELVGRGMVCSVGAGSMTGTFGSSVQRFTSRLFSEGLVHSVSSDAHDPDRRAPVLSAGLKAMESELAGRSQWLTVEAPAAILRGDPLPSPPTQSARPRKGLRRLFG
ncbi:MAG: tyrosine-protein phosphatase [Thermoleophilaceae bacterium]